MLGIHTILHPTDFSDRSLAALGLACALTRDYGARLIVVHVAEPPPIAYSEGMLPPDQEELEGAARQQLERLSVPEVGVRAERRLAHGPAVDGILRMAGEVHADLIVMGTHGRTGLERLLMGSVAEQVVRSASCPVLTVKTPFVETVPEPKLAVATAGA